MSAPVDPRAGAFVGAAIEQAAQTVAERFREEGAKRERERLIGTVAELTPRTESKREACDAYFEGHGDERDVYLNGFGDAINQVLAALNEPPVPGHQEPGSGTRPAPTPRPWDDNVLTAMEFYGGGFVQQLRRAYLAADDENRRRIFTAWPEYGETYRAMAKRMRDRERAEQDAQAGQSEREQAEAAEARLR